MESFIGQITLFAGNFAPRNWALCNGQLLAISQNTALFSILGTTYGGNGQTTFALPDLRGRTPIGAGTGPGLPDVTLGEMAGTPTVTLTIAQMPVHNHTVAASSGSAGGDPTGSVPGNVSRDSLNIYDAAPNGPTMNPQMIGNSGGSQPVSIQQPYLGMNYIICLQGVFPSRN